MLIIKVILVSILSIAVLFFIAKLLGNKQISELNMFDYINGITIGSIAAELSVSPSLREAVIAIIAMLVYGLTALLFSVVTIKSIKLRRFLSGRTLLLIEDGKIYQDNIKKAKLDINDVLTKARTNGYFDISQINYAVMENNGEISFFPKSQYRPVNASDLQLAQMPSPELLNLNVIIDGNVMEENLKYTGVDKTWLKNELSKQGYKFSDVFLATLSLDKKLSVFEYQNEKNQKNVFD